MKIFDQLKYYLKAIKRNWTNKHRLLIQNTYTHENKISILLSPKNIFVLGTTSIFILVFLTILLIAFTPLKVYLPGYTTPEDYHEYRVLSQTVDSLENIITVNQKYIDDFYHVLQGQIIEDEEQVEEINRKIEEKQDLSDAERRRREVANERIFEDAEIIQEDIMRQDARTVSVPVGKRTGINSLWLLPPTNGVIASRFDPVNNQMGIVVRNALGTLISATADGVIIFSGFDPKGGNTVIIQHSDNLISIYNHCETLLKGTAQKVKAGEPIAKMGESGQTNQGANLYFELWYNGIQVNPLDYMTVH